MKEVQKEEDLKVQRCQSLVYFLSIRQAMLANANEENADKKLGTGDVSGTGAEGTDAARGLGKTPTGADDDDTTKTEPTSQEQQETNHGSLLATIVGDVSQFVFEDKSVLDYKPEQRTVSRYLQLEFFKTSSVNAWPRN